MVTPEKCDHLYLVYHFTVPLNKIFHHVCEKKLEDNFKVAKRFKHFHKKASSSMFDRVRNTLLENAQENLS